MSKEMQEGPVLGQPLMTSPQGHRHGGAASSGEQGEGAAAIS